MEVQALKCFVGSHSCSDMFVYKCRYRPLNEPPPLSEPAAILSTDLNLDSLQSIQGPCFMVSTIQKIPVGITK